MFTRERINIANNLTFYCLDPGLCVRRSGRQRVEINYAQFEDVPDEIDQVPGPLLNQEDKAGDVLFKDTVYQDDQDSGDSDSVNSLASNFKLFTVSSKSLELQL